MKKKLFVIISRYQEDIKWINNYDFDYIIYNKGEKLDNYNQKQISNFGGNQYDIASFIWENYDKLPSIIAFVQGNPYDHCVPGRFNELIKNDCFTPLFGDTNYPNGEYHENNDNWYINGEFNSHKPLSKFSNFDEYMGYLFEDYSHLDKIIFPPGSQFIVEKERCLFYSKKFWKKLMDVFCQEIGMNGGREAHIVERSMQLIFENKYKEKQ